MIKHHYMGIHRFLYCSYRIMVMDPSIGNCNSSFCLNSHHGMYDQVAHIPCYLSMAICEHVILSSVKRAHVF